jgi:hypothetical protein
MGAIDLVVGDQSGWGTLQSQAWPADSTYVPKCMLIATLTPTVSTTLS